MEEKNEAWEILIKSLEEQDQRIQMLRQREIDLLQKLLNTENNVKGLTQVIANKLYNKPEPNDWKKLKDWVVEHQNEKEITPAMFIQAMEEIQSDDS